MKYFEIIIKKVPIYFTNIKQINFEKIINILRIFFNFGATSLIIKKNLKIPSTILIIFYVILYSLI